MKIILIGNISAGKTTIAQKILERYKEADYVSIDEIRMKHGDGTKEKENHCKYIFIEMIDLKTSFQIIELTGVGVLGERLFELISSYEQPILIFHIIASVENLLNRAKERKWNTPFPFGKDNIPNSIRYTEDKYKEGLVDSLVSKCTNAVLVSLLNNNKSMMKDNLEIIFNKIDLYHNSKNNV